MRIVGFGREESNQEPMQETKAVVTTSPVRSLVSVSFERMNMPLTYYNDRFDLKPGDRVFVTGKLEGEIGIVESVTTKFRIRLSDYQKVLSLAQTPVRGAYVPKGNVMLSYDADSLSPEDFRKWILPPVEQDEEREEVIFGEGFEVSLDDPSDAEDVDPAVFNRAIEYCRSGKIGYVSIRNGEGRAFVHGSHWYEVEFRIQDHMLQEAYCECPYPGLCKHLLSVGVLLATMLRHGDIDLGRDFTLIASDRFWNMVRHSGQEVSV